MVHATTRQKPQLKTVLVIALAFFLASCGATDNNGTTTLGVMNDGSIWNPGDVFPVDGVDNDNDGSEDSVDPNPFNADSDGDGELDGFDQTPLGKGSGGDGSHLSPAALTLIALAGSLVYNGFINKKGDNCQTENLLFSSCLFPNFDKALLKFEPKHVTFEVPFVSNENFWLLYGTNINPLKENLEGTAFYRYTYESYSQIVSGTGGGGNLGAVAASLMGGIDSLFIGDTAIGGSSTNLKDFLIYAESDPTPADENGGKSVTPLQPLGTVFSASFDIDGCQGDQLSDTGALLKFDNGAQYCIENNWVENTQLPIGLADKDAPKNFILRAFLAEGEIISEEGKKTFSPKSFNVDSMFIQSFNFSSDGTLKQSPLRIPFHYRRSGSYPEIDDPTTAPPPLIGATWIPAP